MSPYEILQPGGSVEYNNEEAGAEWMQRLTNAFPKFAWINPEPQGLAEKLERWTCDSRRTESRRLD